MSDPREVDQPTGDEQNTGSEELHDLDQVDVQADDADKVKGGRMEDPCAGGQIRNR